MRGNQFPQGLQCNLLLCLASFWPRATDHWSALITGIATVVLAVITWRLVALGIEQSATTRAQLRAYLSVVIGLGVNQDRVRELKFEAKPFILNNGETPAYNVRVRIKAEILTDVQIPNFVFIEPPDVPQSQASIGPKENRTMSGLLDRYVPDDEVQDICDGNGRLCMSGASCIMTTHLGDPISRNSPREFGG